MNSRIRYVVIQDGGTAPTRFRRAGTARRARSLARRAKLEGAAYIRIMRSKDGGQFSDVRIEGGAP